MDIYFWLREMAIEAQYKEGMDSERRRRLLEAADEIERLQEELKREKSFYYILKNDTDDEIEMLQNEIERLREALKDIRDNSDPTYTYPILKASAALQQKDSE